ncbi:MAG: O-antigen ligase family protein [Planctomycetota bacterium]
MYLLIVLAVTTGLAALWARADVSLDHAEFAKHPRTWTPTPGTIAVCGAALLAMTAAPLYPQTGLWVYISLAYGFPRYKSHHVFLLHSHLLEWISFLAVLGWAAWMIRSRRRPTLPLDLLSWLLLGFLVWMAVATAASVVSDDPWQPALKHHPMRFFSVAVLFALAREFLGTGRSLWMLGMVLGVSLCIRSLLFPEMIKGDGDLSALIVQALPLVGLSAVLMPWWPAKAASSGLVVYLLWVLSQTHNRGAAVALVAVLVVLWLQSPRKLLTATIAILLVVVGFGALAASAYWQRFADIWEGGPALGSVLGRLDLWRAAWQMFLDHPILGIGPGEFYAHVEGYAGGYRMYGPHNHVMALLSEGGLPAPLLYLALFMTGTAVAWRARRKLNDTSIRLAPRMLACSLVACLATGCFIARPTEPLGYIFAGAAAALSGGDG